MPDMTYYSIKANAYVTRCREKIWRGQAELRSTTTYDVRRTCRDVDRADALAAVSTLYLHGRPYVVDDCS